MELMFFGAYFMNLKASNLGPSKYLSIFNFFYNFLSEDPLPPELKL